MRNAFERFTQDCDARCVSLLLNWRSHEDLVAIQHRIASEIVPDIERPIARQVRAVDGDVSAIWSFRDRAEEMETLAAWMVREVENGVPADRFAILVRMRVDRIAEELGPEFEAVGLMLRNVARQVGEIAIQDLLVEPFTELAMPFLRSAATRRAPDAWTQAQRAILLMEGGNEADEEAIERASRRAQSAVRAIRAFMEETPPNEDTGTELLNLALEEIGAAAIKASSPAYSRDEDYERVRLGFSTLLNECAEEAGTWEEVLNRFEGKDQVPLMTIHKSKGMEFHTVIFFGLDDRSWRSLAPGETEELNNFFVAFTRAEQRAFFTSCSARGAPIAWIEELLGEEVPRVEGADLLS
jgi:superfamily I DNA/RNA helicase